MFIPKDSAVGLARILAVDPGRRLLPILLLIRRHGAVFIVFEHFAFFRYLLRFTGVGGIVGDGIYRACIGRIAALTAGRGNEDDRSQCQTRRDSVLKCHKL